MDLRNTYSEKWHSDGWFVQHYHPVLFYVSYLQSVCREDIPLILFIVMHCKVCRCQTNLVALHFFFAAPFLCKRYIYYMVAGPPSSSVESNNYPAIWRANIFGIWAMHARRERYPGDEALACVEIKSLFALPDGRCFGIAELGVVCRWRFEIPSSIFFLHLSLGLVFSSSCEWSL